MNRDDLRLSLDTFVKHSGHFPTRREFRSIASEYHMYKEFGGMSQLKNWYNVGAAKSRYAKTKDFYLNTLRSSICIVKHEKYGCTFTSALTLSPDVLKSYNGTGTSKKANDDLIFAYDVDTEKFTKIFVSTIESCIPLT